MQLHYNQLLPTGNSKPLARFYGLPKIHKANCSVHPIVSACGMSTYNLARYQTKILKMYIGHTSVFVKDSKDLTDKLSSIRIQEDISGDRVCAPIPKLVRIFIIPVLPNIIKFCKKNYFILFLLFIVINVQKIINFYQEFFFYLNMK